jgi:hypothetical protein
MPRRSRAASSAVEPGLLVVVSSLAGAFRLYAARRRPPRPRHRSRPAATPTSAFVAFINRARAIVTLVFLILCCLLVVILC